MDTCPPWTHTGYTSPLCCPPARPHPPPLNAPLPILGMVAWSVLRPLATGGRAPCAADPQALPRLCTWERMGPYDPNPQAGQKPPKSCQKEALKMSYERGWS